MFKKYKIDDIIADALDLRINIRTIGTLCYAGRNLKKLLDTANSGVGPSYFLYKKEICPKTGDCFKVKSINTQEIKEYPFIILAKDMEVPFRNTLFVSPSQTFAIWVVEKEQEGKKSNYDEFLVTALYEDGVCLNKRNGKSFYNWKELLKNYEFPDGSICGKVPKCRES